MSEADLNDPVGGSGRVDKGDETARLPTETMGEVRRAGEAVAGAETDTTRSLLD